MINSVIIIHIYFNLIIRANDFVHYHLPQPASKAPSTAREAVELFKSVFHGMEKEPNDPSDSTHQGVEGRGTSPM